jgi:hypothetical protein
MTTTTTTTRIAARLWDSLRGHASLILNDDLAKKQLRRPARLLPSCFGGLAKWQIVHRRRAAACMWTTTCVLARSLDAYLLVPDRRQWFPTNEKTYQADRVMDVEKSWSRQ